MSTEIEVVVTGPPGPPGPVGPDGPVGPVGPHPTLTVGDVTTGTPDAEFVDDGQDGYELNLTLPPGPELSIGTVDTGATADAEVTGNPHDGYVLDLTLPPVGANGVNTGAIQNGAVTSDKIADGSIVAGDIAANANIAPTQIAGTAVVASTVDAKGDLLAGTANNTVARLPADANGRVLTTDSTQAAGLRWAPIGVPDLDIGTVDTGTPAAASLTGTPETGYELDLTLPPVGNGSITNVAVSATAAIEASKIKGVASVFNVKDYGAVGDGSTDDTDAIEACIAAAAAAGHGQVYFPETTGGYKTTDTITFDNNADVDMCGFIKYAGPDGRAAIVVGSTSALTWKRNLKLEAIRAVQADWTSEADIGIKLLNVDGCTINIVRTQGFTIGAQLIADGDYGTVHNLVTLNKMWYAKVGLDLYSVNGGWTNENLFFGGNFSVWSGLYVEAESKSRYGIRLRNGGAYGANNNVFHKPSFEIAGPRLAAPAEGVPILLEDDSCYNTFHDVRYETAGTYVARVSDSARRNKIILGYGQGLVDEQAAHATTVLEQTLWAPESSRQVIFHMSDIHKRVAAWHPNESWSLCNVPGMFGINPSSGAIQPYTNGVMHDNYFDLASEGSLGVTVDTRIVKEFLVTASTDPDHPCSLKCRPKDSSGNVINAADVKYGGDPLVRSSAGTWWATNFGGTYTGSVGNTVRFTVCHDDVASVDVFATTGWITSFEISAYSPKGLLTSASTPYPDNAVENVASAAPAFGTYTAGRRVYNNTPAAGSPIGWVCTAAGTPGTWAPLPNAGPLTAVDATLGSELGDGTGTTQALTGLTVGAYYHVAAIGGTLTGATLDTVAIPCYANTTSFKATATSHTIIKTDGTTTAISVKQVTARSNEVASLSAGMRMLAEKTSLHAANNTPTYQTAADHNVGVGVGVHSSLVTGGKNTALGVYAQSALVSGNENTNVGYAAGGALTSGSSNVAVGSTALNGATTADACVAIGKSAAYNTLTASANVAIGVSSQYSVTSGGSNVSIGWSALANMTTGGGNTTLGTSAGRAFTTGSYNTAIGNAAGYSGTTATLSGTVTIGADSGGAAAQATADNQFVLGTANHNVLIPGTLKVSGYVGFYGTTPVAKPTGVAVDAAGIHAALVTLGLIAA